MKKKVLFVIGTPLKNAGVPNVVMQIVRALQEQYQFDVLVCGEESGYFDEEFCSFGGKIFRCSMPSYKRGRLTYLQKWNRLYQFSRPILAHGGYEIVHCNNGLESAAVGKAAAKCGVPIRISHAHGYYPKAKKNLLARWYQWVCRCDINRFFTEKLACSKKAGDSLFDGVAYQNVLNPIDLSQYTFAKQKHTGIHLLQIGYFCKLKNQLFSLAVVQNLLEQGADATLSFIGFEVEAGYLSKMQDYITQNGLEDRIQFLPPDHPKAEILPQTDFLLLPSTSEGLPLVALEGQAGKAFCLLSDAVTQEVDVGMALHLPIEDPAHWANVILAEYGREHQLCYDKLAAFDLKHYLDLIRSVYSNHHQGNEVEHS